MKQVTKKIKAMKQLGEMLKAANVEVPQIAASSGTGIDPMLEAEAMLALIETPKKFVVKNCKSCGNRFSTNYKSVAYCSDMCRATELRKIGISWDLHKTPEQRYGLWGQPLIVPSKALEILALLSTKSIEARLNEVPQESLNDSLQTNDLGLPPGPLS